MATIKGSILVDTEKCKGCGVCIEVCPTHVIALHKQVNGKGYHYCYLLDKEGCVGCASCAIVCPDSCITVFRKKVEK